MTEKTKPARFAVLYNIRGEHKGGEVIELDPSSEKAERLLKAGAIVEVDECEYQVAADEAAARAEKERAEAEAAELAAKEAAAKAEAAKAAKPAAKKG